MEDLVDFDAGMDEMDEKDGAAIVFRQLLVHLRRLENNAYVGRRGDNCFVFVGGDRDDVSTGFTRFVDADRTPNVCTMVVSFRSCTPSSSSCSSSVKGGPLIGAVLEKLCAPGALKLDSVLSPKDFLLQYLLDSGTKLMLLVDGVAELYALEYPDRLGVLHELSALGNQTTGTVCVILAGTAIPEVPPQAFAVHYLELPVDTRMPACPACPSPDTPLPAVGCHCAIM